MRFRHIFEEAERLQKATTAPVRKDDWERATIKGFLSHVSTNGWKVEVTQAGSTFNITWKRGRAELLCAITGNDKPRAFTYACGMLAGWEPTLHHWRSAFKEIGVTA